jgi:hypothetical protein
MAPMVKKTTTTTTTTSKKFFRILSKMIPQKSSEFERPQVILQTSTTSSKESLEPPL